MQNRNALNPTIISVWILLFIASAVLALPTNPIVGAVAGIACGAYFVQWRRKAPSPNWTDSSWARVGLPLLAAVATLLFVIGIAFVVRIFMNFGPVR